MIFFICSDSWNAWGFAGSPLFGSGLPKERLISVRRKTASNLGSYETSVLSLFDAFDSLDLAVCFPKSRTSFAAGSLWKDWLEVPLLVEESKSSVAEEFGARAPRAVILIVLRGAGVLGVALSYLTWPFTLKVDICTEEESLLQTGLGSSDRGGLSVSGLLSLGELFLFGCEAKYLGVPLTLLGDPKLRQQLFELGVVGADARDRELLCELRLRFCGSAGSLWAARVCGGSLGGVQGEVLGRARGC